MKKLLFVRFRSDVNMGGHDRDRWSCRNGETDNLTLSITCVERDDGDIEMTWTGGKEPVTDVIPRSNVVQIRRAPVAAQSTATAAKK